MSIAKPDTIEDWAAHIDGLSGAELRKRAIAANQIGLVRTLPKEGWTPAEVEAIVILLAKRFVTTGQRLPQAGLYDLVAFSRRALP